MKINDLNLYYINLARRTDRRAYCESQFAAHRLQVERIEAVDGANDPIRGLTAGAAGCFHSHWRLWARIAQENRAAIIFEDDVWLFENFSELFEKATKRLPKNWQIVYIGYMECQENKIISLMDFPNLKVPGYPAQTFAYMISPEGAKSLCNTLKMPIMPVDNQIAEQALAQTNARIFALTKPLAAFNDSFNGDIQR